MYSEFQGGDLEAAIAAAAILVLAAFGVLIAVRFFHWAACSTCGASPEAPGCGAILRSGGDRAGYLGSSASATAERGAHRLFHRSAPCMTLSRARISAQASDRFHARSAIEERLVAAVRATTAQPVRRSLWIAYLSSVLVALGIAVVSTAGILWGAQGRYAESRSVLVSQGGDAANLIVVLPVLLGSMWLARRGSLAGMLLWPGALFYALYAYVPCLVDAPFDVLLFGYVALVVLSGFSVIGIVASVDGEVVRDRLGQAPARSVGGAVVVIAVMAYAGLAAAAVPAFADPGEVVGMRGHWIADWVVGTPVLLLDGAFLWLRAPLGYVSAPGLLLVSALGGLAFAAAAVLDNLWAGLRTDAAVIAVHLVVCAVSVALLAYFLGRAGGRRLLTPPSG